MDLISVYEFLQLRPTILVVRNIFHSTSSTVQDCYCCHLWKYQYFHHGRLLLVLLECVSLLRLVSNPILKELFSELLQLAHLPIVLRCMLLNKQNADKEECEKICIKLPYFLVHCMYDITYERTNSTRFERKCARAKVV